ncbi:MAG: SDR family oxidoreductase [Planctomycetota bacterium]
MSDALRIQERPFAGKTAIVTGASSGIGHATARVFAARDANLVIAARRKDRLKELADQIGSDRVEVCTADVSSKPDIEAMISAAIDRFGRLDVLVNNAGTVEMGPIDSISDEDYRRIMAVNVDGVHHAVTLAMPHLLKTRGNVVNVSSVSGIRGDWGLAVYNASKGAVDNYTRALALELGPRGVRVNAVNPSLTKTEMTAGIADNQQMQTKFIERMPLNPGGGVEPEEIARAIAFLASDEAAYITGVTLPVDGGVTASNGQPPIVGS